MAVACNCYIVGGLTETILEGEQIGNLEDQYYLGKELGWGQFGVIRTCSDKVTGEDLACKSISKEKLVTEDDLRSVNLEIEIMSRLSGHPNVVDLKAVYEDKDYVHLVMELCAGGELFHRIEKHGKFRESEARDLFRHLMLVVMYCHDKGIVHRDLKPENILLATKASSSPIKLADFGLATYIEPGKSLSGTVGSPFYIAPEVLAGGYNQAADVWSAGVILYILLSGMPPFWGKTKSKIFNAVRASNLRFPSDTWDQISTNAKDLITAMLCTDPSQRLTALQVLDHCWMTDLVHPVKNFLESESQRRGSSCSTPLIYGNRDISFGSESPVPGETQLEPQSPVFTCKSSFSSFLVEPTTPSLVSGGFSFRSCCETEFSSPIPSLPSFTFFSPSSPVEQFIMTPISSIQREVSMGKFLISQDSSRWPELDVEETDHKLVLLSRDSCRWSDHEVGETENKLMDIRASRTFGIRSKRNHTIGLGELVQLDLMVTESVIRWASCTDLSSTPSLRSSLVC
ncbi:hypothetical protein GIB67_019210 [Kingdonia uniflora]|uniref:non-specific serine/threonine protein kinase n=1 Tax=Kingdonia uniflora TaxID=39325 RepID=A0A7J7MZS7_9MAGN|nr:hypothetical protein GIB67_019210 [Kingdonia uniflora]